MECSTKLTFSEHIKPLKITPPEKAVYQASKKHWDSIAKPLDGMGRFEHLISTIAAISGNVSVDVSKKAVLIMCADNGIVQEGISQSGQEVTAAVVREMAEGISSVGKMAKVVGADTIPVDIGVNWKEEVPGVLNRRVCCGTRNFHLEPAMTESEAVKAILTGIELVCDCKKKGYQLLGTGEMGIGNTTTSSAMAAALLDCSVKEVTGRGAGLDDERLKRKITIISDALERYQLRGEDAFRILCTVGGLDIAGLCGVCIGGALHHIPIVLDGVISMVAALAAERMLPGTKDYLLASHKGKEPAIKKIAEELNVVPIIDGELALGEGTGAVMLFSLLTMALSIYDNATTFERISINQYDRF